MSPDSSREHPHHEGEHNQPPSFWWSRAGTYLIVGLVIVGLLLAYEHRIHILGSNWLLWTLLLACVGMHVFMHGGHGGHGGHSPGGDKS